MVEASGVPQKTRAPDFQKPEVRTESMPWAVQVAATQDKAQGARLVERLEKLGFSAYLATAEISGKGTWYRIRVGGYPDREAAETNLARLKKEGFSPMIISPQP